MVTSAVYRQYMQQHGGSIVNIVADMWNGFPFMSHTGAARAGVVNLTQTLAIEWARNGVRVNAVAPGVILGSGLKNYPEHVQEQLLEDIENGFNPTGRYGTESEVSAAVVFLLSSAASYITGATLRVDGASSLCKHTRSLKMFLTTEPKIRAYNGWPDNMKSDLPPKLEAKFLSKL
jgi:citronellol/citronellal dehydrogenase